MILFIIYTFLKKYRILDWRISQSKTVDFLYVNMKKIALSLFISLTHFFPLIIIAQYQQLNYNIISNGNNVGWMRLEKNINGNSSALQMDSEIKTKVIFPIIITAKEASTFEKGVLISSSQIRKINGKIKKDSKIQLVANNYEVSQEGSKEKLPYSLINTNLLSMYFNEPLASESVYCENRQCFVKVVKTIDGGYKMNFPNGDNNCFYYKEGICTKIKVSHTFYTAEIILKK